MSIWGLEEKRSRGYIEVLKRQLIEASGTKCYICQKSFPKELFHAHHIKPHALGGSDKPSNIAILCPNCHEKIRAKMVTEDEIKQLKTKARKMAKTIKGKNDKTEARSSTKVSGKNCYDCNFYRRGASIRAPAAKYYCAVDGHEIKKPRSEGNNCKKFEPKSSAKNRYIKTKVGYRASPI